MSAPSETMAFCPDLIVEATSVCDRSCKGCYAPNVISRTGGKELQKSAPDLFLSPDRLELRMSALDGNAALQPITLSFRGGEPSRNPFLPELIRVAAKRNTRLFIETHARWIVDPIPGEEAENRRLIDTIRLTGAVVKVSFDRMHGLSAEKLRAITDKLDCEQIDWCVAITEGTREEFERTRRLCSWVPNHRVIYQPKASSLSSLIRPRLGVIRPDGSIMDQLSVRDSLRPTTSVHLSSRKPA